MRRGSPRTTASRSAGSHGAGIDSFCPPTAATWERTGASSRAEAANRAPEARTARPETPTGAPEAADAPPEGGNRRAEAADRPPEAPNRATEAANSGAEGADRGLRGSCSRARGVYSVVKPLSLSDLSRFVPFCSFPTVSTPTPLAHGPF